MRDIIAIHKKRRLRKKQKPEAARQAQQAPVIVTESSAAQEAAPAAGTTVRVAARTGASEPHADEVAEMLPASLSWQEAEYRYRPKSADWYWSVGLAATVVVGVAIFTKNLLLGIFAVVAGFAVMLLGSRRPRQLVFTLSLQGVTIGRTRYPFKNLKSFWIHYEPDGKKELSLESRGLIMPRIVLPLGDTDPTLVRRYVQQFLPEREHEELLLDSLNERIGL